MTGVQTCARPIADWTQQLRPSKLPIIHADPYEAQIAHFSDLVRGESQPLVSLRDATANLIILDAIRAAAESGHSTALDLSPLQQLSPTATRSEERREGQKGVNKSISRGST